MKSTKSDKFYPDIRSRDRVRDLGEVHTPPHIVNDMLDLFDDQETVYQPTTRWLEPSCGHGPFLEAIFERKINALPKSLSGDRFFYQALICLAHIHGVDIDQTNVEDARERQLNIFCKKCNIMLSHSLAKKAAKTILETVIVKGDFLNPDFTMTEWKPVGRGYFKRSDYDANLLFNNLKDFAKIEEYSPIHWRDIGRSDDFENDVDSIKIN